MPGREKHEYNDGEAYREYGKYNSIAQYVTFHCPRTTTGKGFLSFNGKDFRSPPIHFTNEREKKLGFIIQHFDFFFTIHIFSIVLW